MNSGCKGNTLTQCQRDANYSFSPTSDLSSECPIKEDSFEHGEGSPVQDDPEMDAPPEQAKPVTRILFRKLKLTKFVQLPTPPPYREKKKPGKARVLTSAEYLLELDEKEAEKKKQTELNRKGRELGWKRPLLVLQVKRTKVIVQPESRTLLEKQDSQGSSLNSNRSKLF